ncbi:Cysteine-rich repeat secretory protein 55 [Dendrobium catenatum]|uniref:Cysteine-rich repeat secretory protein 55 n=1 Tax=Dendrobium catenatum TaxID=906689 RepID=A0A2I0WGP8_9ASPA|nr:Cysteine-rich repeat secretory protein 55 [Dendrobium catenatum]
MAFSYKFFLLSLLLLPLANCENFDLHSCAKNITDDIDLHTRIVGALYHLIQVTPITGFASSSFSSFGDSTLYALAQCRGDTNTNLCRKCIKDSGKVLFTNCSNQAQAYIWYDLCFVRYDIVNFLGNWTVDGAETSMFNSVDTHNLPAFIPAVIKVIENLKSMVVTSGDNLFAKMVASNITNLKGISIYGMAECTRDMNESTCMECLDHVKGLLHRECKNKSGCRILHNSCFLRYETYDFFNIVSR